MWDAINQSIIKEIDNLYFSFDIGDCNNISSISKELRLKQIISFDNGCELLEKCNLYLETKNKRACIFNI